MIAFITCGQIFFCCLFVLNKEKDPKPESDKANRGLRPHMGSTRAHVIGVEMLCLFPSKLTSSKQGTKRQNQSMKIANEK